jgi:hypothetical protein
MRAALRPDSSARGHGRQDTERLSSTQHSASRQLLGQPCRRFTVLHLRDDCGVPDKNVWLERKLEHVESQMLATVQEARSSFTHAGTKGSVVEASTREFLKRYLPSRLSVGHGEVIDSEGRRSCQSDIVVTNEDHPLSYPEGTDGVFFIEGVDAVGEVKTVLTTDALERSIHQSQQFKSLRANEHAPLNRDQIPEDYERFYLRRPSFILAYESQLRLDRIATVLRSATESDPDAGRGLLDAVFVAKRGTVLNFGSGNGGLQMRRGTRTVPGWVPQENRAVLFSLVQWLASVMPRVTRQHSILLNYVFPDGFDIATRGASLQCQFCTYFKTLKQDAP